MERKKEFAKFLFSLHLNPFYKIYRLVYSDSSEIRQNLLGTFILKVWKNNILSNGQIITSASN